MSARQFYMHGSWDDVGKCIDNCGRLKYNYTGLLNGDQCVCDNHYPIMAADWFDCRMPCEEEPDAGCGRPNRMKVFDSSYGRMVTVEDDEPIFD